MHGAGMGGSRVFSRDWSLGAGRTTLPGVPCAIPLAAVGAAAGEVRAPVVGASSRAAAVAAGERGSGSGSGWGRPAASPGAAPCWGTLRCRSAGLSPSALLRCGEGWEAVGCRGVGAVLPPSSPDRLRLRWCLRGNRSVAGRSVVARPLSVRDEGT